MEDASGKEQVEEIVAKLSDKDPVARQKARASLVKRGASATPPLLEALDASQQHVRWEAAKALAEIRDPDTAERLVLALGDDDSDVRWVAGEALIALRAAAAKPLLAALTVSDPPDGLYRGAHHVLHALAKHGHGADAFAGVLAALDQPEPELAVPLAAEKALGGLAG